MCGIAGIVDFESKFISKEKVFAMQSCLTHRGPDGSGTYFSDHIALAHRRLSIIDLNTGSAQPMTRVHEGKNITLVFNGEIYNFRKLRDRLLNRGYVFKSDGDTEVVLYSYIEFGNRAWELFEGFFALAIWDERNEELTLVRDSLGIKPLYFSQNGKNALFASELKSILAVDEVKREMNPEAITNFFSHFYVPSPLSPVSGVSQIEPGQVIQIRKESIRSSFWWELEVSPCNLCTTRTDHMEHVCSEITSSVSSSLESDVPVGLLLSGGLDSHIVLQELIKLDQGPPNAITIGFKNGAFDESGEVLRSASSMKFTSEIFMVSNLDLAKDFDSIVHSSDTLNANFAAIAEFYIFKEVHSRYKVVLTGMGVDELFAGYQTYYADILAKKIPTPIAKLAKGIPNKLANIIPNIGSRYPLSWKFSKFIEGLSYPEIRRHFIWRTIFSEDEKKQLFGNNLDLFNNYDPFYFHERHVENLKGPASILQRLQYADFRTFCIDNANLLMDAMSMSHSVESRPPLLTNKMLSLAFTLPDHLKVSGGTGKAVLRQAYKDQLPKRVVSGKKVGLVSPVGEYLRNELRNLLIESINEIDDADLIDSDYVKQLAKQHLSRIQDHGYKLYLILVYLRWRRIFLKTT